ncbi:MAG: hypothetical protein Hens2KO_03800 [Henriciella sp.]
MRNAGTPVNCAAESADKSDVLNAAKSVVLPTAKTGNSPTAKIVAPKTGRNGGRNVELKIARNGALKIVPNDGVNAAWRTVRNAEPSAAMIDALNKDKIAGLKGGTTDASNKGRIAA